MLIEVSVFLSVGSRRGSFCVNLFNRVRKDSPSSCDEDPEEPRLAVLTNQHKNAIRALRKNHKNCSKEHPPARMQASHRCGGTVKHWQIPPASPRITCYDGNPRNQGLVGVDGACVIRTLHMAPCQEV
ncbi:potassium voltage-gated channel subfamily KQT member 5 [Trichonephila clavipes]|nr:potassium voltage-gated channel subfamily KQT member 5 [Trichonephila clavipes]